MFSLAIRVRRILGRFVLIGILAAAHFLAGADMAWAKSKKEAPAEVPTKSYVFPYAIVVLGVALGLIVVLRPVKRDNEPKQDNKTE